MMASWDEIEECAVRCSPSMNMPLVREVSFET
jgi:hypothetical protein